MLSLENMGQVCNATAPPLSLPWNQLTILQVPPEINAYMHPYIYTYINNKYKLLVPEVILGAVKLQKHYSLLK